MRFQDKIRLKKSREKVIMLTAYDYQVSKILDEIGIDMILVGDSLGMVVQGRGDTKSVKLEEMLYHTEAVARGAKKTPIIGDMPINSYNTVEEAVTSATRFLSVGAHGVKIEGNRPDIVKTLIGLETPVMGHVGMLPQSAETYRVKGKTTEEAEQIFHDALSLDRLGVFSIVLECIPETLGKRITENVTAPTIGIGAGKHCDGQVLVINDLLGFNQDFKPRFVKRYANLNQVIGDAVAEFADEVAKGEYPDKEHTYH
ncbi:MAG: 3-methyl-2-oxobutanoate hydroxymethyltransferase [Candidatus Bathyarchaeota archaeon]|nr:3-methyl-2-oxobutanoate hydroxymethyltransferase [Candidatus Bathyarchaeota archaeon]